AAAGHRPRRVGGAARAGSTRGACPRQGARASTTPDHESQGHVRGNVRRGGSARAPDRAGRGAERRTRARPRRMCQRPRGGPRRAGMSAVTTGPFAGRRVVVTGGSRGIGRATALAFAREGATVGITYAQRREDAEEALAALAATGASAHAVQADVADATQVTRMFDELRAALGGHVDVLVNNAAVTHDALLMMLTESAWDRVLDTDLKGA